jgi:hypothetical protein
MIPLFSCQQPTTSEEPESDAYPAVYRPYGNYSQQNPYPTDLGQRADILVTLNGSSQPQTFVSSSQPFNGRVEARAINFPYRTVTILGMEVTPRLPNIQLSVNGGEGRIRWLRGKSDESIALTVRVRDQQACQAGSANNLARCQNTETLISSSDFQQSFQIAMMRNRNEDGQKLLGIALLGAGIGALASVILGSGNDDAFGGALAGSLNGLPSYGYGGGIPFNVGFGMNPWSQFAGVFGAYPGYGYPGLGGGNSYGGFYNDNGFGYGDPRYYNANNSGTWDNGFNNYYNNNAYYYDRSRPYDSTNVNSTYCRQNPYVCQSNYNNIYGNAAYYNGWGNAATYGRGYNYFDYNPNSNLSLTGNGEIGEPETWVVH